MPKNIKNYKDKSKAKLYRNSQRKTNYKHGRKYQITQNWWTVKEIKTMLNFKKSDFLLSKKLGRSVQGIQIKRSRVAPKNTKE